MRKKSSAHYAERGSEAERSFTGFDTRSVSDPLNRSLLPSDRSDLASQPSDLPGDDRRGEAAPLGVRLFVFFARPLSAYWVLNGAVLVAGVIETTLTGHFAKEAFSAAGVLIGVTRVLAAVKDVPPWPWSDPDDDGHD
jgi:hypothetical protein